MAQQNQVYRWHGLFGINGYEHASIWSLDDDGFVVTGETICTEEASSELGVRYVLVFNLDWELRTAEIAHTATRETVTLISDGMGSWTDGDGKEVPELQGCFDIDIEGCSFTKTAIIRQLDLEKGDNEKFDVVSVGFSAGGLEVAVHEEQYLCLDQGSIVEPEKWRFRYENFSTGFAKEFYTDDEGLSWGFAD